MNIFYIVYSPSLIEIHHLLLSVIHMMLSTLLTLSVSRTHVIFKQEEGRGGGALWSSFAGYVPLASQNPYLIIVYNLRSILWPVIDPILLVTFGYIVCSWFIFVAN